jgi:glycosyltransferase involved in cell wall biosynthesis
MARGAGLPEPVGLPATMRERLRVLHVTPYFAPAFAYGGPPRSILGLCRGLDRAGVLVQVFTTTANGPASLPASFSEGGRHAGVAVRYFPRAFPRRLFGAAGLAPALAAQIGHCDLVHTHGLWHWPGWTAARHARRRLIPHVISPRGMLDAGSIAHHAWRKQAAYWMRERRHLEGAALLHAASDAEARTLARRVPSVSVAMLPNGVDAPADEDLARGRFRHRLGLAADAPLIVLLGRLHPIKRLDLLAAAFAEVRARYRTARLVIAGPDEDGYRGRVEPLFAPERGAVHWTGEVGEADKWALLADADALVMCSDSESFGLSVLEAMAAGVPVVATRTCPWEEVETAGCGFWVPHDAHALASALGRLLGEPAWARAMGQKGRVLARAKYSWDSIAGAMAGHYEDVVVRNKALTTTS